MTQRGILLTGTSLALMLTFGVAAMDDEKRMHPADANGDGVLEKSEAIGMLENKFGELDKDGDGFLTVAELPEKIKMGERRRHHGGKGKHRMKFEGKSFDEFWPMVEEKLREKGMSDEEIAERKEKMQERHARMAERKAQSGERGERRRERMEKRREKMEKMREEGASRLAFVARFDKDGDEKVSLAEFTARAEERFNRADKNGDGRITEDERPSRKHKKRMKKGDEK